jgi:predicted XRE-type DNA-binding protein
MKITGVSIDRRRKELVIVAGRRTFCYPMALLPVKEELVDAVADQEIGREGVECRFASGRVETIHLDDIRAQLGDAGHAKEVLLYELTLKAQELMKERGLSRRALCRLLATSPAQVYRLLDQTCSSKSIDKMVELLRVLGYRVSFEVTRAA